jgi:hypothetical protein
VKLSRILPPLPVASVLLVTACGGSDDASGTQTGAEGAGDEAAQEGGSAPTTRVALVESEADRLAVFE